MYSMTGFGQAIESSEEADICVEIRTVNSRYLDLRLHLPLDCSWLEPEIRKVVQAGLRRGRVDFSLEILRKSAVPIHVSDAVVESYLEIAEQIKASGVKGELDVSTLLGLPGVVVENRIHQAEEGLRRKVLGVVSKCLEEVRTSRASEGASLRQDLTRRVQAVLALTRRIQAESERVEGYYREKLAGKLAGLASEPDEGRLAQEILYYVERADISEEVTRLEAHALQFQRTVEKAGDQAVGRQLDFIGQEMGREMNTVLSKAPLAGLSELAVEGKAEIERIREQLQNVE